jgi:hypothetical protein
MSGRLKFTLASKGNFASYIALPVITNMAFTTYCKDVKFVISF